MIRSKGMDLRYLIHYITYPTLYENLFALIDPAEVTVQSSTRVSLYIRHDFRSSDIPSFRKLTVAQLAKKYTAKL
jgi:hypothetical protein